MANKTPRTNITLSGPIVVVRFNQTFQCLEFRARKHSGWTIHRDLALEMSCEAAEVEAAARGGWITDRAK